MNTYTPYRDKMCVICGEKPYIVANIHSEWCCEDCLDLTNDAPITATISKVELTYDTIFRGKDNKPILSLKHDGQIIVDGEPNEAAKVFLEILEKSYGSLPHKVKQLEAEINKLRKESK